MPNTPREHSKSGTALDTPVEKHETLHAISDNTDCIISCFFTCSSIVLPYRNGDKIILKSLQMNSVVRYEDIMTRQTLKPFRRTRMEGKTDTRYSPGDQIVV